ncbi:hypothetical protein LINGRAHAP2_LOCUS36450 [Linum grandiflorum]
MLERGRESKREGRWGSLRQGQRRRSLRIQGSSILIQDTDGFNGADYRLSVSDGHSSFFVVFAEEHLVWLVGVLKVAASQRWSFPMVCEAEFAGRRIHIGAMWRRGRRLLCVSESSRGGRSFYVRVPVEENSDGWPGFLKTLASLVTKEMEKPSGIGERSFAEVVRPLTFPLEGDCETVEIGGVRMVKVGNVGMGERKRFLECCLVVRLVGSVMTSADWLLFEAWSKKWWGTKIEGRSMLSDDLWLIKLPSKEDVERVLKLGRWQFRDWSIQAGEWLPFAGRSKVTEESGMVWIRLEGIPVHVRSDDLFRQLGDFCGRFVETSEEGCSWNAIRIKVRQLGVIPCIVPVEFEGKCYPVKVTVESGLEVVVGWKGKGNEVFVRIPERSQGAEDDAPPDAATERIGSPSLVDEERDGTERTGEDRETEHDLTKEGAEKKKKRDIDDGDLSVEEVALRVDEGRVADRGTKEERLKGMDASGRVNESWGMETVGEDVFDEDTGKEIGRLGLGLEGDILSGPVVGLDSGSKCGDEMAGPIWIGGPEVEGLKEREVEYVPNKGDMDGNSILKYQEGMDFGSKGGDGLVGLIEGGGLNVEGIVYEDEGLNADMKHQNTPVMSTEKNKALEDSEVGDSEEGEAWIDMESMIPESGDNLESDEFGDASDEYVLSVSLNLAEQMGLEVKGCYGEAIQATRMAATESCYREQLSQKKEGGYGIVKTSMLLEKIDKGCGSFCFPAILLGCSGAKC